MSLTELIHLHIGNVGNPTHPEIYTDDVVMEFPYAPKHHTGRREGREGIVGFLGAIGKYFREVKLGEPKILLTKDPNVAVVEVPGSSISEETGKPYSQNYISIVTARDGKLAHIREYYDPIQVLVATGEIEEPGS